LFVEEKCTPLVEEGYVGYAYNTVGCNTIYRTGAAGYPQFSKSVINPAWQRLGIPAPAMPPKADAVNVSEAAEDEEIVHYVSAYVNADNSVGPPSLPSEAVETNVGQPRIISGFVWPDASWGVTWANVYVSAVGTKDTKAENNRTEASLRYVGTVYPDDAHFSHDGLSAGTAIESLLYEPPPNDLTSIAYSPEANVLAGISPARGVVAFSEPYADWAFPPDYYVRFGDKPLRVVCNDSRWFVLTDGRPYVLPLNPNAGPSRKPDRIDEILPLLGPRSVATFAGGVVYASKVGLVVLGNNGSAVVVTTPLLRDEDWYRIQPNLMVGAVHDGFYYGSTPVAAFRFRLQTGVFPLKAADQFMWLSVRATAWHVARTGGLFFIQDEAVYQWCEGTEWLPYRWRSPTLRTPVPLPLHYAQVDRGEIGELTALHHFDGNVVSEQEVRYARTYRVSHGVSASTTAVEFVGTAEVLGDGLAVNVRDFA